MNDDNDQCPVVSVIVTSYNYERYIAETLESVLKQTYRDFELIVFDDGSKDNSLEIIRSYMVKDPRMKLFTHKNKANKGLNETLKVALSLANGKIIAFLESDDIWDENYLQRKIEIKEKFGAGIIFNNVFLRYEENAKDRAKELRKHIDDNFSKWNLSDQEMKNLDLSQSLYFENIIPTFSCVMVDKEILKKCNFNAPVERWLDWWLWFQIAQFANFLYVSEKLTGWRIHAKSQNSIMDNMRQLSDRKRWHYGLRNVVKANQITARLITSLPFVLILFFKFLSLIKREGLCVAFKKLISILKDLYNK